MNIVPIPIQGFAPSNEEVSNHLRHIADWIENGDYGDIRQAVIILETCDGHTKRITCGQTCDLARVIGLLTIAAHRASEGRE